MGTVGSAGAVEGEARKGGQRAGVGRQSAGVLGAVAIPFDIRMLKVRHCTFVQTHRMSTAKRECPGELRTACGRRSGLGEPANDGGGPEKSP